MSVRCLLVSYNAYPNTPSTLLPDNGLASLAGVLQAGGHQVTILDYNTLAAIERLYPGNGASAHVNTDPVRRRFDLQAKLQQDIDATANQIVDHILRYDIRLVGFKLMTGPGYVATLQVARKIRQGLNGLAHPPRIFAGGPHIDWFGERILEACDVFDGIAYGEGELTIARMAQYAEGKIALQDIPNLLFLRSGATVRTGPSRVTSLDELPFPVYDPAVYPAMEGDQKIKILVSEFSRGCPYQCCFCGHAAKSGTRWRSKSATRIAAEIRHYHQTNNIGAFRNGDSNTPPAVIKRLPNRLLEEGINVEYGLVTHFNHLADAEFVGLRASGCISIFLGMESGSQRVLDEAIGKHAKVAEYAPIVDALKHHGIFTVTSVIVPAPFETDNSQQETFGLLESMRPDAVPVCTPLVMPNSAWAHEPNRFGIELAPDYFDALMTYGPTLLLPPSQWQRLPYRVNGFDCSELLMKSQAFADSLESAGLVTQVCDDIGMMARYANLTATGFRDQMRACLALGQSDALHKIVATINSNTEVRNC